MVVWMLLKRRSDRWTLGLRDGDEFFWCGIEITDKVVTWKPLLAGEAKTAIGHKMLTQDERKRFEKYLEKNSLPATEERTETVAP